MTTNNAFIELQELLAPPPLQIGTVTAVVGGICTVNLVGGGTLRARGQAAVSDKVFVRGEVIEGPAPALTEISIEV